ncbi:cuticle protein 67-like [Schistocerca serialis cubense]|uniref:cuticle protein 67-like n=1 Tax=Schistocerca serialis cubense TaxID=2023355 RepID=UPI00214E3C53|nr:cuticle protein 67-like [Schistocerca serialis cubense]
MYKLAVFAAVLAVARAGFLAAPAISYAAPAAVAPAAITSQSSNILRSFGNLGQVSTYTKTVDTPYSSVTKSDVRVSNDAVAHVAAPAVAYAAPAYARAYASPAAYAAPAVAAHGLLGVAYSAAPAVAHLTYSTPALSYAW